MKVLQSVLPLICFRGSMGHFRGRPIAKILLKPESDSDSYLLAS